MNSPGHAHPQPTMNTQDNELNRQTASSKIRTPFQFLALFLASLTVMAPWPLIGILLTRTSFEEPTEAFMLFGGITLFPLMILALFGSVSEFVFIAIFMIVWVAAAAIPILWLHRRLKSWSSIIGLLAHRRRSCRAGRDGRY